MYAVPHFSFRFIYYYLLAVHGVEGARRATIRMHYYFLSAQRHQFGMRAHDGNHRVQLIENLQTLQPSHFTMRRAFAAASTTGVACAPWVQHARSR